MTLPPPRMTSLVKALRLEGAVLGSKVRASRAILGWSQAEFAMRVGLTQKSVHQIEQALVEPRWRTVKAIEDLWRSVGLSFDDLPDGGFRIVVSAAMLSEPAIPRPAAVATSDRAGIAAHHG